VKAYQIYDPQSREDVERFYDIYAKGNLFERVPYLLTPAVKSVTEQQSDAQLAALMKSFDYRKVADNGTVDRLMKEGFFEKLSAQQSRLKKKESPGSLSSNRYRPRVTVIPASESRAPRVVCAELKPNTKSSSA
jgi:hypothetical protein